MQQRLVARQAAKPLERILTGIKITSRDLQYKHRTSHVEGKTSACDNRKYYTTE
jgi:hypothetical protein